MPSTRTVIEYRQTEPITAKGKVEPVPAWIAIAPLVAAGERVFSEVPIVGRGEELAALRGMWEIVSSERRCSLLTVFGPAGIGKSRLAHELAQPRRRTPAGSRSVAVPRATATPARTARSRSTWRRSPGIYDSDDAAEAVGEARASGAPRSRSATNPARSPTPSRSWRASRREGAADRETLYFSARLFVEAVARDRPTMLVFEDIHFTDPSLLDLVEYLASRVQDVPLLMVATSRPELLDLRPTWGGGLLHRERRCSLEPLSEEDAVELTASCSSSAGSRGSPIASSRWPHPATGTRCSSRSSRRRSPSDRPGTRASYRGASAASWRRGWTRCPSPERDVVLDASVVGKVFWRGALERLRPGSGGPRRAAGLARAARPDPPRGVVHGSRATSSSASSTG